MFSMGNAVNEVAAIFQALATQGKNARADSGVSILQQLGEMLWLRMGAGKLQPQDYYKLRVYRRQIAFDEKRRYMSNRAVPRKWREPWAIVATDKLLTYALLSQFGIPTPINYAVCHQFREYRSSRALKTIAHVAGYLRTEAPYPLIVKPVQGVFSKEVHLLMRYDSGKDTIDVADGAPVAPEDLAEVLLSRGAGYLLQQALIPHRKIREEISERICSLRIVVAICGDQARVFFAAWKINQGSNVADNYWRDGNMLAELDGAGKIVRCMTGLGPKFRYIDRHPKSNRPLAGFSVPHFQDAVDMVLRGSRIFPGLPVQAWDIAITDAGPVAIEVNVVGSLFIPQLIRQRGLMTAEFMALAQ